MSLQVVCQVRVVDFWRRFSSALFAYPRCHFLALNCELVSVSQFQLGIQLGGVGLYTCFYRWKPLAIAKMDLRRCVGSADEGHRTSECNHHAFDAILSSEEAPSRNASDSRTVHQKKLLREMQVTAEQYGGRLVFCRRTAFCART